MRPEHDTLEGMALPLVNAGGRPVVPGYIKPHCHPWCLYNPSADWRQPSPPGVTTLMYDDLPFLAALGRDAEPIMDALWGPR